MTKHLTTRQQSLFPADERAASVPLHDSRHRHRKRQRRGSSPPGHVIGGVAYLDALIASAEMPPAKNRRMRHKTATEVVNGTFRRRRLTFKWRPADGHRNKQSRSENLDLHNRRNPATGAVAGLAKRSDEFCQPLHLIVTIPACRVVRKMRRLSFHPVGLTIELRIYHDRTFRPAGRAALDAMLHVL